MLKGTTQLIEDGKYTYLEQPLTYAELLHWITGGAL